MICRNLTNLDVNEFNQQHTAEVAPGEYSYAVNEFENQGLDGNGQVFQLLKVTNAFVLLGFWDKVILDPLGNLQAQVLVQVN